MMAKAADKRVHNIAAEVNDATDSVVPRILLKLQNVLDSFSAGSHGLMQVRHEIYRYQLLHVTVTTLKQDFSKILDGWNSATRLSNMLGQCCVGLDPPETQPFQKEFLPSAVDTLLHLSHRLQTRYIRTSDVLEDTKNGLLEYMKGVTAAISLLLSGHTHQTKTAVESPWMMQLLITDDRDTSIVAMNMLQSTQRLKTGVMGEIDIKLQHQLMDELIYKLSASSDCDLASMTTRTILAIAEAHPPVVDLLCTRYKGLRLLLNKWKNQGFSRDLNRLLYLLEAGSHQQAQLKRQDQMAMIIQAWWRSYATRKKLGKAQVAIGHFQRSFRQRKMAEQDTKEQTRQQSELQYMLVMSRRKTMRDLRQKQLLALQILPAADVPRYLTEEENTAALAIQRRFRGWSVRQGSASREKNTRRLRAAVTMQRTVRKWLERVRARKREPPLWQRPPGLTDERRVALQARMLDWREDHQVQTEGEAQRADLHEKVQGLLKNQAMRCRATRRTHQQRDALLARLQVDAELMSGAPSLHEVQETDIDRYVCHSVPIATKARHNHQEELRLLRQPWWRKLGNEYQDQKSEEELGQWKVF